MQNMQKCPNSKKKLIAKQKKKTTTIVLQNILFQQYFKIYLKTMFKL